MILVSISAPKYCWQLNNAKGYSAQSLMLIIIGPVFTRKRVDFKFQVNFLTKPVFAG